jgi:iron(III) transport system permease protein
MATAPIWWRAVNSPSVGAPLGVLLGKTDLPLRGAFTMFLTLPLLVPPYVVAIAWSAVLGSTGWIGRFLAPAMSEFLSSAFFGFYGCIGALSTAFMPVVMLLTIAYLGTVNPRLEQAGLLMSRWPSVLWRITLPLIARAILFAAVLVFLLTLGEVGVPTFLRYPVYPVEILTQFAAFYDFSAATAAAIPMLIITVMILVLEIRLLRTSALELSAATIGRRNAPIELGRWRFPMFGLALVWTLVTVALPLAVLIVQSASLSAFADAFSRASDSILRSVVFAAIGATLLTLLGFFCGYLIHNRCAAFVAKYRRIGAVSVYLARNRHRHRAHQPMEQTDHQRDLRHLRDHHSGLPGSICRSSHADDGRNLPICKQPTFLPKRR